MKKFYDMMKQAQQIQEKLKKTQESLADVEVEATSGGGVVRVVVNGHKKLLSLEINKEVVDPEEVEMLQDLIISAVNSSMEKAGDMINEEIGKVTGGLPIPNLF
jgi:DNA-binding YbaB/EbfC family protein